MMLFVERICWALNLQLTSLLQFDELLEQAMNHDFDISQMVRTALSWQKCEEVNVMAMPWFEKVHSFRKKINCTFYTSRRFESILNGINAGIANWQRLVSGKSSPVSQRKSRCCFGPLRVETP
jgi:hypothetical protein